MQEESGRFTMVFNGEIYNHETLRQELAVEGILCRTRSDTEVLLRWWIRHGVGGLARLNGMFAFAIWDKERQELFLARDRLGVKPLYLYRDGTQLLLASELTPLIASRVFLPEIELSAVVDLFSAWYISEPKTILKKVFQLPPGSWGLYARGELKTGVWWALPNQPEKDWHRIEASEVVTEQLKDSVRLRLKADVPSGTFLSGGVDSGLVTSFAREVSSQRVESFGIGFRESSYSELDLAAQTARRTGVDFFSEHIDEPAVEDLIRIIGSLDQPLGNASFVPTWYLARNAARQLKVVLTGDGADECFGGYPTYQAPWYRRAAGLVPRACWPAVQGLVGMLPVSHRRISLDYRLKQFVRGARLDPAAAHFAWREISSESLRRDLLAPCWSPEIEAYDPAEPTRQAFAEASHLSEWNRLMYADLRTYLLNDHLPKVDRTTMAHSLEARNPFLDYRLVETAFQIPARLKLSPWKTKIILKQIGRPLLPLEVIRGKKKGLTTPVASWLDGPLGKFMESMAEDSAQKRFCCPLRFRTLLQEHRAKKMDHSRLLWAIFVLTIWCRQKGI